MTSLTLLAQPVLLVLTSAADQVPEPEDVKAGWLGFGVFLALAVAVAVLGFSLRKHLRKVDFEGPGDARRPAAGRAADDGEPAGDVTADATAGGAGPVTHNDRPEGDHPPLS